MDDGTIVAIILALFFASLFLWWQHLNRTPPTWDEAIYLIDTWTEWNALFHGGLSALYRAFLTVDPGRVGLVPLIGVAGFIIAGPTAKAAILPFAALWIVAIISIFDFALQAGQHVFGLDRRRARAGATFACVFFATYPLTQVVSLGYYVEFPLMTAIAALNASAMRYWLSGRLFWAWVVGLAVALGLLCKVTFPAFAISAVGLVVWRLVIEGRSLRLVHGGLALMLPPLLIAAPVYITNARAIIELTGMLSSASMASVYGLGRAFDPAAILRFFTDLFSIYEFLTCALLSGAFLIWIWLTGARRGKLVTALILAATAVPLLVVATSNFKLERYAHPGFIGLFVLAGLGLGLLWRWTRLAALISAALFLLPAIKIGAVYNLLSPSRMAPVASLEAKLSGFQLMQRANSPDPRDWLIAELVAATNGLPRPVILLGTSATFHQNLLRFASLSRGFNQEYDSFLYQLYPNFIESDLLRYLDQHRTSAVLYKSPPYPMFLGNGVAAALAALSQRDDLVRTELPFEQPDRSHFILFVPKRASP